MGEKGPGQSSGKCRIVKRCRKRISGHDLPKEEKKKAGMRTAGGGKKKLEKGGKKLKKHGY